MSFLGLMTVRTHEAVVADLEAEHAAQRRYWRADTQAERESVGRLIRDKANLLDDNSRLRADCDKMATELATLKAKRDQQTRNLKQFRKVG